MFLWLMPCHSLALPFAVAVLFHFLAFATGVSRLVHP